MDKNAVVYIHNRTVAQMVKRLLAMWETWVRFLGQEDPLEKEMEPTPVFLPGVHVVAKSRTRLSD